MVPGAGHYLHERVSVQRPYLSIPPHSRIGALFDHLCYCLTADEADRAVVLGAGHQLRERVRVQHRQLQAASR